MSRRWRRFPPLRAGREPVTDEELRPLVVHHLGAGAPTGWFEPAYQLAVATGRRLPWQEPDAHPWVGSWLDAPVLTPPGTRALVIGCGSGAEVAELARRGFSVVGLDVAPTALAWAAARLRREPRPVRAAVELLAGDLLHLDPASLDPVDLVVEVHTVPWLPGVVQDAAMAAVGPLLAPGGVAVTITQLRAEDAEAASVSPGPPWPQAPSALASYRAGGLERLALEHPPRTSPGPLEIRVTWQRPHAGTGVGLPLAGDGA